MSPPTDDFVPPPPPLTYKRTASSQLSPTTPTIEGPSWAGSSSFNTTTAPAVGFPPTLEADTTRPYACGQCSRAFARPDGLQRHQSSHRTHTLPNRFEFECYGCARRFTRPDFLHRHQRIQHQTSSCTSNHVHGDANSVDVLRRRLQEEQQRTIHLEQLIQAQQFAPIPSPGIPNNQGTFQPPSHVSTPQSVSMSRSQSATGYSAQMGRMTNASLYEAPRRRKRATSDQGYIASRRFSNRFGSNTSFRPVTTPTNPHLHELSSSQNEPANLSPQAEPFQHPCSMHDRITSPDVGMYPGEYIAGLNQSQIRSELTAPPPYESPALLRLGVYLPQYPQHDWGRSSNGNHFQSSDLGNLSELSIPVSPALSTSSSLGSADTGISHPPTGKRKGKKMVRMRLNEISGSSTVERHEWDSHGEIDSDGLFNDEVSPSGYEESGLESSVFNLPVIDFEANMAVYSSECPEISSTLICKDHIEASDESAAETVTL